MISGHAGAVARVGRARGRGEGPAIPLKVSAPFHCALMAPAARAVEAALGGVRSAAALPVVANFDAQPNATPERAKGCSCARSTGRALGTKRSASWLEAVSPTRSRSGPGKVLAGLVKRIDKDIRVLSVGDAASLDAGGRLSGRDARAALHPARAQLRPDRSKAQLGVYKRRSRPPLTVIMLSQLACSTRRQNSTGHRRVARHRPRVLRGAAPSKAPRSSSTTSSEAAAREVADCDQGRRRQSRDRGLRRRRHEAAETAIDGIVKRHGGSTSSWRTPASPSTVCSAPQGRGLRQRSGRPT